MTVEPRRFQMRLDEAGGAGVPAGVVEVSFEQAVPEALRQAILEGLDDAPVLLADALHVAPPRRPYQRVEIAVHPGDGTQGEALALGAGAIRLTIGAGTSDAEARRIARHEALHLLLASALRGAEKWNDPEIAFGDWIVRGIESGLEAPRFRAPLPEIVTRLPKSRHEVAARLTDVSRQYFGDELAAALENASPQRRLWLVEAALGVHHLEAAARLGEGALRAVILDDWLLDYEQYARAVGNAPADAGNLWRLSDPGDSLGHVTLNAVITAPQVPTRTVSGAETGKVVLSLPLLKTKVGRRYTISWSATFDNGMHLCPSPQTPENTEPNPFVVSVA